MKFLGVIVLSFVNSIVLLGQNNGWVDNKSSKIYYETYGEGDPILIINGGPGMNSRGFRSIAKLLSKNHKTIIYDQRGTGNSTVSDISVETITMDLMVSDIEKLRKHLKLDRWIVMGHSFGGMLASYYTTKHPSKISALLLSSSGGLNLDLLGYVGQNISSKLSIDETRRLQEWTQRISKGDTMYHARLERGKALAPAYLYDKNNVPQIAERLTQLNLTINSLVFRNLQKINFDCSETLKSFDKPVLIIQGKQDIIDQKTATSAHKVFPNSRLVLLDECGHYGWLDKKEEYLSEVFSFLESI